MALAQSLPGGTRLTGLEVFVFSTAVGLNVLSTYVLVVGLLGWLRYGLVFAVPIGLVVVAAGWLRFKQTETEIRAGRHASAPRNDSWLSRWKAMAGRAVCIGDRLGRDAAAGGFDVREYHLQVPKEFLSRGGSASCRITSMATWRWARDAQPAGDGPLGQLVAGRPGRQDGDRPVRPADGPQAVGRRSAVFRRLPVSWLRWCICRFLDYVCLQPD